MRRAYNLRFTVNVNKWSTVNASILKTYLRLETDSNNKTIIRHIERGKFYHILTNFPVSNPFRFMTKNKFFYKVLFFHDIVIFATFFHFSTTRTNEDTQLCHSKGTISINQSFARAILSYVIVLVVKKIFCLPL